jgi:hypothetical protein
MACFVRGLESGWRLDVQAEMPTWVHMTFHGASQSWDGTEKQNMSSYVKQL